MATDVRNVRIGVRADGGDDAAVEELRALESWLRDEPTLRGRIAQQRSTPRAGEMSGGLVEALVLTLGTGASAALVRTLPVWLRQRRSRVEIELRRGRGQGVVIKADNLRRGDAEELIRRALAEDGSVNGDGAGAGDGGNGQGAAG